MKRVMSVVVLAGLCAAPLGAQQPAAGEKVSFATSLQRVYATLKMNLTQEAEKMPDADYGYRPGSMDIRTYGRLFGHVTNAQFNQCSTVKGVPNPNQGNDVEAKKTKAEIVKALADSFAFCDEAFASLTDENALQYVKQGPNEVTRASVLAGLLAHGNEMYGTGAVYLRAKGLVPPSTERASARR